jgi:hypothetical protein
MERQTIVTYNARRSPDNLNKLLKGGFAAEVVDSKPLGDKVTGGDIPLSSKHNDLNAPL